MLPPLLTLLYMRLYRTSLSYARRASSGNGGIRSNGQNVSGWIPSSDSIFLHSNGITHGDLNIGNVPFTVRLSGTETTSSEDLQQHLSLGTPLQGLDGDVDLWLRDIFWDQSRSRIMYR